MSDPFRPTRRRQGSERRSDVDTIADRLRVFGASTEEVIEFRQAWATGNGDRERLHELVTMDDTTLRRMLSAARGDDPDNDRPVAIDQAPQATVMGVVGGAPQGPSAAPEPLGAPQPGEGAAEGSEGRPGADVALPPLGWSVPNLLGWVNGDPVRARALLDAELARAGDARKSLVGRLEALVDAAAG